MPHPNRCLPPARAMIVAPQPEAVEAGADVLRRGGNALERRWPARSCRAWWTR